jgi:hypothetical protein
MHWQVHLHRRDPGVVTAHDIFLDAIEGKLGIENTDLYPYSRVLAEHCSIHAPLHNSTTSQPNPPKPIEVELVIGISDHPWLAKSTTQETPQIEVGTEVYVCTIHYTTILTLEPPTIW